MVLKNKYDNVVLKAMDVYDIGVEKVEFFTEETNVIYKVMTARSSYALKIFEEASSTYEDNLAEAYFLNLVEHGTDLCFPKLLKNIHDEPVTLVYDPEEEKEKRVMVYEWMDGLDHEKNESLESFEKLGEIIAKLHRATRGKLPQGIAPKKWDKVFFYRDEVAVYHEAIYNRFVDEETKSMLDRIIPVLDIALKKIYDNDDYQLIHGDLNPWNIKIHDEQIFLIDYEEAMLGYPVHDLATLLYYYQDHRRFSYETVKNAFLQGYRKNGQLDFDEKTLETLIVARRVNFMNYVLTIREDPSEYIRYSKPFISFYLKKYGGGHV